MHIHYRTAPHPEEPWETEVDKRRQSRTITAQHPKEPWETKLDKRKVDDGWPESEKKKRCIPPYQKIAQVKVLHMLLFPAERHMKGLLTV